MDQAVDAPRCLERAMMHVEPPHPRPFCFRLVDLLPRAVLVSNQPRPKTISEELRDYYLKQTNGRELLEGVKLVPGAEEVRGACLDRGR